MTCEECKVILPENSKYCIECGAITDIGVAVKSLSSMGEDEEEKIIFSYDTVSTLYSTGKNTNAINLGN